MYEFKDPTTATGIAMVALALYLVVNVAAAAICVIRVLALPPPLALLAGYGLLEGVAIADVFVTLACWILVGRWIYRVSANAHALSSEMEISPGWAVGWYFVPIANLFKPYQAMKEVWYASHWGGEGEGAGLLPWWWGLWLVSSFLGRATGPATNGEVTWLDVAGSSVDIAVTLVLITIMRRLVRAQLSAVRADVFA